MNCEYPGCSKPDVGYLPETRAHVHPRGCAEHADPSILFQRSYGYVDREEAEQHVLAVIMEAVDALNEAAEYDGFRDALYRSVAEALGAAHETLRAAVGL